jgi:hypothetical protein
VEHRKTNLTSVTVTHQEYATATPIKASKPAKTELIAKLHRQQTSMPKPSFPYGKDTRAPPTYPFHRICDCQRTEGTQMPSARNLRCFRLRLPAEHLPVQIDNTRRTTERLQALSFTVGRSAM